jgi:hypothetical protein
MKKPILTAGFLALALVVVAQNAAADPITVISASDSASLTGGIIDTITDTGLGSFDADVASGSAYASLDVLRTGDSLDYAWATAARPGFGAQAAVSETFSLSALSSYAFSFSGSGYLTLYLQNIDTGQWVAHYGTGHDDTAIPTLPFSLSGTLAAGNYRLTAVMGSVVPFSSNTGAISFDATPVPDGGSTLLLVGLGLAGMAWAGRRWKSRG